MPHTHINAYTQILGPVTSYETISSVGTVSTVFGFLPYLTTGYYTVQNILAYKVYETFQDMQFSPSDPSLLVYAVFLYCQIWANGKLNAITTNNHYQQSMGVKFKSVATSTD